MTEDDPTRCPQCHEPDLELTAGYEARMLTVRLLCYTCGSSWTGRLRPYKLEDDLICVSGILRA